MSDASSFEQFMKERELASQAYVEGDTEPLGKIVADLYPATFFPPTGGFTVGTAEVASKYERDAKAFEKGSQFRFEVFDMAADGDVAYWVGLMRGTARMRGRAEPVQMQLRVTEIFRRESGKWKLVHRHADPLFERTPQR